MWCYKNNVLHNTTYVLTRVKHEDVWSLVGGVHYVFLMNLFSVNLFNFRELHFELHFQLMPPSI